MSAENYLARELTALVQNDPATWRFLQEGSLDGVWYWDLEKPENEWMSPEFWKLFGIDPATKDHSPDEWQDIIFTDDLHVAMRNFEAHCADENHPYDQIVRYRHADGSTVWVRCRGKAIRDETGKPVRMLGAHSDITAVKRSEENARAGWRAAELANAELRSFAYSVSHDMKAPTNTLKLLTHELRLQAGEILDQESEDILSMASDTVDRMQNLIEDVLDYTRIIGEKTMFEPVDLSGCVDAALNNLTADIRATDAQIDVADLPVVSGSRGQMTILFQNLLANALKFHHPEKPPVIRVSSSQDSSNSTHLITVRDQGIGIADHNHDRIFGLFQRLHNHDDIAGTGIGLPTCQRIAVNHHGDLTVDSALGRGAAFTLALPWSQP